MLSNYATKLSVNNNKGTVSYHDTPIVQWDDGNIILYAGGYKTNTTKKKMNQAADQFDLGYSVFQKNFEWFVEMNGMTYEFDTDEKMVLDR